MPYWLKILTFCILYYLFFLVLHFLHSDFLHCIHSAFDNARHILCLNSVTTVNIFYMKLYCRKLILSPSEHSKKWIMVKISSQSFFKGHLCHESISFHKVTLDV